MAKINLQALVIVGVLGFLCVLAIAHFYRIQQLSAGTEAPQMAAGE